MSYLCKRFLLKIILVWRLLIHWLVSKRIQKLIHCCFCLKVHYHFKFCFNVNQIYYFCFYFVIMSFFCYCSHLSANSTLGLITFTTAIPTLSSNFSTVDDVIKGKSVA